MIRSMTGFGRAELSGETVTITVEARSVNHRHLDVGLRLPNAWSSFESDVGRALDELVERRSVEGAALAAELRGLGTALTDLLGQMSARAPIAAARREERLRERMTTLLASAVDEARIATEVAVWATKTDVTE